MTCTRRLDVSVDFTEIGRLHSLVRSTHGWPGLELRQSPDIVHVRGIVLEGFSPGAVSRETII